MGHFFDRLLSGGRHGGGHHGGHGYPDRHRDEWGGPSPQDGRPGNAIQRVMVCGKCGGDNPAAARFCIQCGEGLGVQEQVCAQCGGRLPPGAKFCSACGKAAV